MVACTALVLRERWEVDDPFLDFLCFMHDLWMYREMLEDGDEEESWLLSGSPSREHLRA